MTTKAEIRSELKKELRNIDGTFLPNREIPVFMSIEGQDIAEKYEQYSVRTGIIEFIALFIEVIILDGYEYRWAIYAFTIGLLLKNIINAIVVSNIAEANARSGNKWTKDKRILAIVKEYIKMLGLFRTDNLKDEDISIDIEDTDYWGEDTEDEDDY